MERRRIAFAFKGNRHYIHGTDMFNAVIGPDQAPAVHNIHFTIHGMVGSPSCQLYESDSSADLVDLQKIKVRANFQLAGATRWVALSELPSQGPGPRYEYLEDRVTSLCDVRTDVITLNGQSPFTFIETVVAMNKWLHQKLFADAVGQWMFVGIELPAGCNARQHLSLRIGREVNYRLTRAQILLESQPIGNLCFSLVKP